MYAVLNFHWKPTEYASMTGREKAFVIACIDKRVQEEKAEMRKVK
jgi:hypothetical protein